MNLLLDTHVLLWWLADDPTLDESAREAVADGRNLIFVSAASIWEIVIKRALGKLTIPDTFRDVLDQQPFRRLDVSVDHCFMIQELPSIHRDPFDRMLIAQCLVENLTLATRDRLIKRYDLPILDA